MGNRRMFSKSITFSGKFLRMPPTARLLYYDLGMQADDDGVVEAYPVMTQTKATDDDLKILISKGYVSLLNDDLVVFIHDWKVNNLIKSDRYHPSLYKPLLIECENGTQLETTWNTIGTEAETEVKLSKEKISKDNLGKDNNCDVTPAKHTKLYYPQDELLNDTFLEYIAMRNKIKAPMTDKAIELAQKELHRLSDGDNEKSIAILNQSIMNSWKGLFGLSSNTGKTIKQDTLTQIMNA